ncbi:hypothetical protein [Spirosoma arcticum]
MNRYMFAFTWLSNPDPQIAPAEHEQVVQLIAEKRMEQMFLAQDRSRGWLVMLGETAEDATNSVNTLPFSPIMQLDLTPLIQKYP